MRKILLTTCMALFAISMNAQLLHTTVAQGEVEGVEENGLAHYKGIPFATPPVGDLRWKAPRPAQSWQGVYKADTFKAKPYQQSQGPARPGQPGVSEDCLYLNVLTPAKIAGELGLTFGQLGGFGGPASPSDEALSRLVMQYWINFIKTGDPNGGYLPLWPAYAEGTESVMNFRDGAFLTGIHNLPQLQLWEEYMIWRREHKTPAN